MTIRQIILFVALLTLGLACFLMPARLVARIFTLGDMRDVDRVATVLYSYAPEAPNRSRGALLAGTIYVVRMLPDFLVRLVVWLMANSLYRIRTIGEDHLPKEGALFVTNHVSWVDALLVAASCDRMVRYLMFRPYYEWKGLNWFFRMMHAIPVASNDRSEKIQESLALARREIRNGHVVCIFAEGAISRTGNLLRFRRGLERIAAGVDCPIVPVYLDGVWGSIFSFDRGRFLLKRPRRMLEPVTVLFGRPLSSASSADEVRQAIQELSVEAFRRRKRSQRPIGATFIRRAKRRWFGILAAESGGVSMRQCRATSHPWTSPMSTSC